MIIYKNFLDWRANKTYAEQIADLFCLVKEIAKNAFEVYYEGEWNNTTNYYKKGMFVSYNGKSYIKITEGDCINLSPENKPEIWQLVAEGQKGINWKGEWVEGDEVKTDDAYSYDGSSYIAQEDNITTPPSINDPKWGILAKAGGASSTGGNYVWKFASELTREQVDNALLAIAEFRISIEYPYGDISTTKALFFPDGKNELNNTIFKSQNSIQSLTETDPNIYALFSIENVSLNLADSTETTVEMDVNNITVNYLTHDDAEGNANFEFGNASLIDAEIYEIKFLVKN